MVDNLREPSNFGRHFRSISQHLATLISLGLITLLWAEVSSVPSQVWTGLSIVLMLVAIVANRADQLDDRRLTKAYLAFFGLYCAGIVFSYVFVSPFHPERLSLLGERFTLVAIALIFYAFGVLASQAGSWPGYALAAAAITIYIVQSRGDFGVQEMFRRYDEDQVNIAYQQLGDSLALCALVLVGHFRNRAFIYGLSLATVVLLFIVPSRSAAVFGSAALLLACLLVSTLKVRVALITLAVVSVVVARVWIVYSLSESLEGTRHESLLTQQEDSSNQERLKILEQGMDSILENPVFGHFGFELDRFGERGMYIHNFLDVWAQAGILPWIALLILWVLCGRQWYFLYRNDRDRAYRALPFLMFGLASWLYARSTTYPLMYFTLGYFSSILAASIQQRNNVRWTAAPPRSTAFTANAAPVAAIAAKPEK